LWSSAPASSFCCTERLGHGNFLPWIEAEFGMSEWTARNFMRVAEEFGGKSGTVPDLPPTVLYQLAAPSTPEPIGRVANVRRQKKSSPNSTLQALLIPSDGVSGAVRPAGYRSIGPECASAGSTNFYGKNLCVTSRPIGPLRCSVIS
jgi:hypothetical protein